MKSNLSQVNELIQKSQIRHISFDFWNTLAISNPEFKRKRTLYFKGFSASLSDLEIQNAFREVADQQNAGFIVNGLHGFSAIELYSKVCSLLNIKGLDLDKVVSDMGDLFSQNPPLFTKYLNTTWMNELHSKGGITFSITSNTAFVEGKYVREVIYGCGQIPPFSFMLFSDEILSGKPSGIIFSKLYECVLKLQHQVGKDKILHVGDDDFFDCHAADTFGFKYFKVQLI